MTDLNFPEGLPYPQREGYEFEATENIITTPTDAGRPVERVDFLNPSSICKANWLLTEPQGRLLRAWCDQVAKAQWFNLPMLSDMGFDIEEVRLRKRLMGPVLVGQYLWRYTAEIEVKKTPIYEEGWAEILPDWILEADIIDRAMNQYWPLFNFDYPTYAAMIADTMNILDGDNVSVREDETRGGQHSYYKVTRADSPSLELDFILGTYGAGGGADIFTLVTDYE